MHSAGVHDKKTWVSLGEFKCHAGYVRANGFREQIQGQARAILLSHLQQTRNFHIQESHSTATDLSKSTTQGQAPQSPNFTKYIVSGDIIEFGRKETAGWMLWRLLAASSNQVAYAKVNLNIINASTLEVVHSVQGAGQFYFTEREFVSASVLGASSFDWVLSGKVLDLAVVEAVNRLSEDLSRGQCLLK